MSANLADIKVGDRVWVGDYNNPRRQIQPVARLTPKQIILDGCYNGGAKSEYNRYWRGRKSPYGDKLDYSRARRWATTRITDIATPQEIADYERAEYAAKLRKQEAGQEHARAEAKRKSLEALFFPLTVSVVRPYNTTINNQSVEWSVTLYGSESAIRRWAEQLKGDNL